MPRQFWGYYDNGTYRVGCNGATIWVYDQSATLLRRFSDISYVYCGTFRPGTNIFVAKSTGGLLAIYDFNSMKCIKKYRFGYDGAQDEGFAFSLDGQLFYNIQKQDSLHSELAVYDGNDFRLLKRLFYEDKLLELTDIEVDETSGKSIVLGFRRDPVYKVLTHGFLAELFGDELKNAVNISESDYDYYWRCKRVECSGNTDKIVEQMNNPSLYSKPTKRISLFEEYEKRRKS